MLQKSIKLTLFLAIPVYAYAFSLSGFLNTFKKSTSSNDSSSVVREESIQSLKVFEPNTVFAHTENEVPKSKDIVKEESISFDPEELPDNLGENNESHGDNALYTVQKNDSIYSIASYFGVSVQTIMTFNHMTSKSVHPGDVLEVPSQSGILYTVGKGDTIVKIAKKYNVDTEDVLLYNGLQESDSLTLGDELFLPGAKQTEKVATEVSPKKTRGKNILTSTGKIRGEWANGDTQHLNTQADINKYSSLPKYAGYYLMPTPGATRTQKMHGNNGVDLANRMGAPVLASADGVVSVARTGGYNFGYGNYIKITHSNGTETLYGHLSRVDVAPGQAVTRGQQIGAVGSTGNSTGPHLHFEVRGAYNPFAW